MREIFRRILSDRGYTRGPEQQPREGSFESLRKSSSHEPAPAVVRWSLVGYVQHSPRLLVAAYRAQGILTVNFGSMEVPGQSPDGPRTVSGRMEGRQDTRSIDGCRFIDHESRTNDCREPLRGGSAVGVQRYKQDVECLQPGGHGEPERGVCSPVLSGFVPIHQHWLSIESHTSSCGDDVESELHSSLYSDSGGRVEMTLEQKRLTFLEVFETDGGWQAKIAGRRGMSGCVRRQPLAVESDCMARHFGEFGKGRGRLPGSTGNAAPTIVWWPAEKISEPHSAAGWFA